MLWLLPSCLCQSSECGMLKSVYGNWGCTLEFLLVIRYALYGPAIWPLISAFFFFLSSTGLNLTSPSSSKWNVSVNLWLYFCYSVSKDRYSSLTNFLLPGEKQSWRGVAGSGAFPLPRRALYLLPSFSMTLACTSILWSPGLSPLRPPHHLALIFDIWTGALELDG